MVTHELRLRLASKSQEKTDYKSKCKLCKIYCKLFRELVTKTDHRTLMTFVM